MKYWPYRLPYYPGASLIIVAFWQKATMEYSLEYLCASVCVCVQVCFFVCVFLLDNFIFLPNSVIGVLQKGPY